MEILRQFISPACAKHTLICLPHAGGGTSRYRSWVSELELYVDVLIPVLPGRENRFLEPAHTDVSEVVAEILSVLGSNLKKPVFVCGISYGALIAYELALALQERHADLAGLYVASQRSPCFQSELRHWHHMSDKDLIGNLSELGGVDTTMDPEFLELFLETIRADLQSSDDYLAFDRPPLTCPVHIVRGVDDPVIDERHVRQWQNKSQGRIQYTTVKSGHFLMDDDTDLWLREIKKDMAARLF